MMIILILVFFAQFAFIFYLYETIKEMEFDMHYLESLVDILKRHFIDHLHSDFEEECEKSNRLNQILDLHYSSDKNDFDFDSLGMEPKH